MPISGVRSGVGAAMIEKAAAGQSSSKRVEKPEAPSPATEAHKVATRAAGDEASAAKAEASRKIRAEGNAPPKSGLDIKA